MDIQKEIERAIWSAVNAEMGAIRAEESKFSASVASREILAGGVESHPKHSNEYVQARLKNAKILAEQRISQGLRMMAMGERFTLVSAFNYLEKDERASEFKLP